MLEIRFRRERGTWWFTGGARYILQYRNEPNGNWKDVPIAEEY